MTVRDLTSADVADAELERLMVPERRQEDEQRALFILRVEDSWLATDANLVEAVLDDTGCSPVPGAPPHVLGVVTHGDHVLALLDVALFCGLPKKRAGGAGFTRTVVLRASAMVVGVRCDVSAGVIEVQARDVRAPTAMQGERLVPYLSGECETPWGLCGILDVARLLEDARVRG